MKNVLEFILHGELLVERIIIRTKTVVGIASKVISECDDNDTLRDLVSKHGEDYVLEKIFDECALSYDSLLKDYENFKNGEKSLSFEWMYIIDSKYGITINEHISLYCNSGKAIEVQDSVFPWKYMESSKYIGDSWWFDDEEIIRDIQQLSLLAFLEKYKGY